MSHTHMVRFDNNHALSTNSCQIPTPYLPSPLLFLVLSHWIHLVWPLWAWVWGQPMEYRKPSRGHVPNKENLFSLPEAINSSDVSGASEAPTPSMLGFLLLSSCDDAGIVTAMIMWSFAGNPSCCRLTGCDFSAVFWQSSLPLTQPFWPSSTLLPELGGQTGI